MIPTSDLRKGNIVKTEHGILPVHHIVFDDIYVLGKDGRVLYAREVEGVGINVYSELITSNCVFHKDCIEDLKKVTAIKKMIYMHDIQNTFYWITGKELKPQSHE